MELRKRPVLAHRSISPNKQHGTYDVGRRQVVVKERGRHRSHIEQRERSKG